MLDRQYKTRVIIALALVASLWAPLSPLRFAAQTRPAPSPSQDRRPRRTRQATAAEASTQAPAPTQTTRPQTIQQVLGPPPPPPTPRPTPTPAPVEGDDGDVISVVSKLVVVPVSVTDARGEPVRGLTASDFRIEERGRAQEVSALGDPDDVPLELAMLLDVSGSVRDRFDFERDAATRFLRQVLRPADRATLFFIDATPRLLSRRNTAEDAARQLAAARLSPDQTTAFYDTVVEAARFLRAETSSRHRRVIIALTDGFDTNSEQTRDILATVRAAQGAEAVFYALNPSGNSLWLNEISKRAQAELVQLAAATGGAAFVPAVAEDLDAVFRRITAELRSQYLIQYYSNNEAAAGTFLPIKVTTPKRTELRVRARQGYYAGASPSGSPATPTTTNKE